MADVTSVVGQVVGPGDVVCALPDSGLLRLGPGLTTQGNHVHAMQPGVLRQHAKRGQLWLDKKQRRYIPSEGEPVVGFILDRAGENLVVDINAPFSAQLPQLSFEGATKRNRPNLRPGDVVYARVASASRDMDPVLTCVDAAGRAAGLGHLKPAAGQSDAATSSDACSTVVRLSSLSANRMLASPAPQPLQDLGSAVKFELVAGANGRAWVACNSVQDCVLVANVLSKTDTLTDSQARTYVAQMLAKRASAG